ncbi:YjfA family protein (plasmid) [Rhodococcus aetherivorans]|uniref:YjfA family protein n=1 Tax=Rhodococcus aetherivorans TaxID=191292 RepID=A0AA46SCL9_9NOCA|nr:YjfA family protein [Rhodococcus aetherivorans]UYF97173.1 YjfA family protein [Rhodococcus aetherivorans]
MLTTKSNIVVRAMSLVAATVLALFVVIATASSAQAAPRSGDPLATGCATNATTIWKRTIDFVTVEVRYSPACGTNWVRVSGATNRQAEAGVWSPHNGWQWSPSYGKAPGQFWTPMVYAPGSTCINFQARFSKIGVWGMHDTGVLRLC